MYTNVTKVQADLLCTNDVLYQGTVSQYFARDGQLMGIFLRDPQRFDRVQYLKAKEEGKKPDRKDYWQPIPSQNLYFFVEKIINMNRSYQSPLDETRFAEFIRVILKRDIDPKKITITRSSRSQKPPSAY